MLLKTSGWNHKWAIQPHFTTHNNKLNACCLLPEYLCGIRQCLLRNLPSMDNAHTLGHNPIITLNLHKKGPCCIYGRSPKQNLSHKKLLNYSRSARHHSLPLSPHQKTKHQNSQDVTERLLCSCQNVAKSCLYIHMHGQMHIRFIYFLSYPLSWCKLMGVRTMSIHATLRTIFYVTQIKI